MTQAVDRPVGKTPLVKVEGVYAKLECTNPCGSIKDRIGQYVLEESRRQGLLQPGQRIVVEPPQFAGPGPVRPSPPPGSLSFGTTLPRGPSLHPTAVADADVLLPGGAIALGARRQGPAGE